MATLVLTFLLGLVLITSALLHKLRRVHTMLFALSDQSRHGQTLLFRQLEALQGLYRELDLEHSLPPTRDWAASPDFLLQIVRYARTLAHASVLECSSGVSTVALARCMQRNGGGHVYSLEHDPIYAQRSRAELARHGLETWATVLDAPLITHRLGTQEWSWYDLRALPLALTFDLLVIDGPPQATQALARYPAGPLLFARLKPGATIYLDDASRSDERATVARWQTEFPTLNYSSAVCEKGCAVFRTAQP